MAEACHAHRKMRNAYKILVGKSRDKGPLGGRRRILSTGLGLGPMMGS